MSSDELRELLAAMTVRPIDRATLERVIRQCLLQPSIAGPQANWFAKGHRREKSLGAGEGAMPGPERGRMLAFQEGVLFALSEMLTVSGFAPSADGSSAAMEAMPFPTSMLADSGSAALESPPEFGRRPLAAIAWAMDSGSAVLDGPAEAEADALSATARSSSSGPVAPRGEREMVELMAFCQECPEFHSLDGCRAMAPDRELDEAWQSGRCPESRW